MKIYILLELEAEENSQPYKEIIGAFKSGRSADMAKDSQEKGPFTWHEIHEIEL